MQILSHRPLSTPQCGGGAKQAIALATHSRLLGHAVELTTIRDVGLPKHKQYDSSPAQDWEIGNNRQYRTDTNYFIGK
jgi:hypothetical protein